MVAAGGWDIVIMNPPYVGRNEVRKRFDAGYLADLESHYGRTHDLMIHFGRRAFELANSQHGTVSMIFNDSIFTSVDADDFRRQLFDPEGRTLVLAAARTRCFEGRAVNGGVIVASHERDPDDALRWVENHGHPPADLAGASVPAESADRPHPVGESELWVVPRSEYLRLPHRPLFRPSSEARALIGTFEQSAAGRSCHVGMLIQAATGRCSRRRRGSSAGRATSCRPAFTMDCPSTTVSCCSDL